MYTLPSSKISGCIAHFLRMDGHGAAADEAARYDPATRFDTAAIVGLVADSPATSGVRLARAWAAGRRADVDRALGAYERTGVLDIA